jgi:hypothetical protein
MGKGNHKIYQEIISEDGILGNGGKNSKEKLLFILALFSEMEIRAYQKIKEDNLFRH